MADLLEKHEHGPIYRLETRRSSPSGSDLVRSSYDRWSPYGNQFWPLYQEAMLEPIYAALKDYAKKMELLNSLLSPYDTYQLLTVT